MITVFFYQIHADFATFRASAICNAFVAALPQVLDNNLLVGNQLLPLASMVLQYLPSPQRYASDYQPPNYSLWYLEPHTRHCWLWSLLLVLYKVSQEIKRQLQFCR